MKNRIKTIIIDKNKSRTNKSKALGVQAGSLESLQGSFGHSLVDKMLQAGKPARTACVHIDDQQPIAIDFASVPSAFNYILILEQSETEEILEQQLNSYSVSVARETSFVSLQQNSDGVVSQIQDQSGRTRQIHSSFVVGCDGAHSEIRRCLQFDFRGGSYHGDFILGDVEVDWPWDYDKIRVFVSDKGVLPCFPMKDSQKYRLIPVLKKPQSTPDAEISLEEFKDIVQSLCPGEIKIKKAFWMTRFRVHHRMTQNFQKGRVFLAGDAAHIHSPAGGQGMNTGIQDALNLSFKLYQVLRQNAPREILENYENERIPVAKKVLWATDLLFKAALSNDNFMIKIIRSHIAPKIVRSKFFQKRVTKAISEISIARKEINERENAEQSKHRGKS